jgi:hypothetical protein
VVAAISVRTTVVITFAACLVSCSTTSTRQRQLLPWLSCEETSRAGGLRIPMGEAGGTDAPRSLRQTLTWRDAKAQPHRVAGNNFQAYELAGGRSAIVTSLTDGSQAQLYLIDRSTGDARQLASGVHRSWEVVRACDGSKFFIATHDPNDWLKLTLRELDPDASVLSEQLVQGAEVLGARGHALLLLKPASRQPGAAYEVLALEQGTLKSVSSGTDWNAPGKDRYPYDQRCGESLAF